MANKRIKSLKKALAITYADDYCDRDELEVLYQLEQQGYTVKKIVQVVPPPDLIADKAAITADVPSYKEYCNSHLRG